MSDGTKADDIALALEEAIVSGEIPPGSTLRQEHLSEQFQVSRTPVREALRRLAALGLVNFEPNRGVRVRMLSRDEIREAFMVRAELEGLATEIATPKMTDDDLAELERAERRFHRATEALVQMSHDGRQDLDIARDWLHLNHSFHDVIYRAADVPLIERMAKAARRTFLVKPVWATGADLDELYLKNDRQHRAIRDAIAARSPEGARVLAREHVLSSGRLLEAILDKVSAQSRERPSSSSLRRRARAISRPYRASVTFERPRGAVGIEPARLRERPREELSGHDRQERREQRRARRRARKDVVRAGNRSGSGAARDHGRARLVRAFDGVDDCRERRVVGGDRPDGEERVECRDGTVCEVGRGERLGRDATRLEELERDLPRDRELGAASDDEHAARVGERDRDGGDARLDGGDEPLHLLREPAEIGSESVSSLGCMSGEQPECRDLVRERLRRRDRAFVSGPQLEHGLGLPREHRGRVVRDRDGVGTATAVLVVAYSTTSGVRPDCESASAVHPERSSSAP